MKKYNRLINGLVITCVFFASGFFYTKNVQAAKMKNQLQTALQSNDYDNAKSIYDKIGGDIFISKLFGLDKKADNLTKEQYEIIKNSYLSDSITYYEFSSAVESLMKINSFYQDEEEIQAIEKIEALRASYREAEASMTEKDYKRAVEIINKIENSIDDVYKNRLNNLKIAITNSALKDAEDSLNNYISKKDYSEGIIYLNNNKDLLPNDYINEKTGQLNELINKKKKEDELKKKKAKETVNKKDSSQVTGYVPNPKKESVVSAISSKTSLLVWVDISHQKTNIFTGSKGNWKLIRSFSSSTGKPGDETPKGIFTIKDKGKWFFSQKYQEGAKYWVRFTGSYLFHSLPMDQNQKVVDPTLGSPASHGCVRLGVDNAAWFYNNIPTGTTVYIK